MRILILDDNQDAFALTDNLLKDCIQGAITFYANEEIALYKLLEHLSKRGELLPDLILIELHMPGFDAWEMLKELQRKSETRVIPIAFFTRLKSAKSHLFASRLNTPLFYKGKRFIDQAYAIHKLKKWFDNLAPTDNSYQSIF
ncbi:Response regulator receiver domain-containing protein [Cnuella takakiae]|uniref:Response regulator receiver domain-containing protein n=1 Tax=Cnuella takakiae TaxID=1302690 RepID=A0A1M4Z8L6_9BACT|nr:response regulator [Cnuella takakiae]OLY94293.1 hypothetical protein BUE76_22185 [Cnuella takakiae]SHF14361.1 Response regulator receiver domain-containing protein [Cnuella takakiae]